MITKKIKAPDWFDEGWTSFVEASREKCAAMLGSSLHWYKSTNYEAIKEKTDKLDRDKKTEYIAMMRFGGQAKSYLFSRFKAENLGDHDILYADELSYNEETKEIIIKRGVFEHIIDGIKNLVKDTGVKVETKTIHL